MVKKPPPDGESRERIAEFLPDALASAASSYHIFMNKGITGDKPKDFSDHHKAAKVAVAHIQLLMKLGDLVQQPGDTGNASELAAMMQKIGSELAEYQHLMMEDGEDNDE